MNGYIYELNRRIYGAPVKSTFFFKTSKNKSHRNMEPSIFLNGVYTCKFVGLYIYYFVHVYKCICVYVYMFT